MQSIGDLLRARDVNSEWNEFQVSSKVYRLLISQAADLQIMTPMFECIARSLQERLGVEMLAARFGYSAGYWTRLFRRYTGYSPYQFIQRTRLDHGKQLLTTTKLPIQEIADQTGFSRLANFSSAFRRSEGRAPREFRKLPL